MKILLVNPPQEYSDTLDEISKGMEWSVPPLGLAYIAAVLEEKGIEVKIYDGQIQERLKFGELNNILKEMKPDLVGITSSTPTFHRALAAAKNIKKLMKVPIVLGGPHVTALPLETLKKHKEFDIAVIGEGEYIMLNVVRAIKNNKPLSNVKGIAFNKGSKVIFNNPAPYIRNLDELPFPARHLLPDIGKYNYVNFRRLPVAHMLTSRGCPFNCIFCDHPFGKSVRMHSPDYSIREIEHLVKEYGIKEIQFPDENIMFDKKRLSEICDKIIERKINIAWSCFARTDRADYELFKKMKKAGCWMISFGVESGNQKVLNFIKKGITLDTVRKAVKASKKAGIETRGSFMIGHPIDTKETIKETIKFAKSLKLDYASFSITVPYPGSELYAIAEKYGTFKKEDFSKFKRQDSNHLSFVPHGLTEKELIELQKKARIEFYFKSTYALRALKNMIKNPLLINKFLRGGYSTIMRDLLKIRRNSSK